MRLGIIASAAVLAFSTTAVAQVAQQPAEQKVPPAGTLDDTSSSNASSPGADASASPPASDDLTPANKGASTGTATGANSDASPSATTPEGDSTGASGPPPK